MSFPKISTAIFLHLPKVQLCFILPSMASNKTATIIFKGDDQISPAIKGATASVAGLKSSLGDISSTASNTGVAIKKAVTFDSLQLNAISQSFSAIAGKLTELKGAAVGAFTEISKAERKLSTVSDESKELIKNFGNLAAANKFQTTTAELAGASYEVLSAGFTKQADATKILDAATKGAVGGFSDVTTVSRATVSALNAYGQGADKAASFVSKFVSVQQSGLITVDEYARQLPRIAPTASLAKLSIDELNGAIATATASGVPVEATFSGLRTALGAILKPTSEAAELAEDLGIKFNATALKTKGLSGILKELKASGNDSAETLVKLFGSQEAVAAIAPLILNLDKLDKAIESSKNSAALLGQNFQKAIDPIKALQNETTEALAVLGRDIVKVFNPAIAGTKAVIQAFRELPQPLQEIIAVVVGGGAAIAVAGASISGFLAVLTPTLAGLTLITTAFSAANIATGLAAVNAALFSPVVLTAGVSATTAAVGVGLFANGLLALATGVALALPPLALLAGAIVGIQFAKSVNDLKGFNEELEITLAGDEVSSRNAFNLANKIRNLNEERKKGVAISEEQRLGFIKLADQEIADQKRKLDATNALKPADESQRISQIAARIGFERTISALENQRKALAENIDATDAKSKANLDAARSEEAIKEAIKERIDLEKRGLEDKARIRGRAFEGKVKTENTDFETKVRDEKRVFEAQLNKEKEVFEEKQKAAKKQSEKELNIEKKVFEDAQKVDKKQFERELTAESKQFSRDQKTEQKTFNAEEKAFDKIYQKEKQIEQRAFDKEQEKAKEVFNKKQREENLIFDLSQNKQKKTADDDFSKRRLEIERKLQLDANPQDKTQLEAEFKLADEKAAKEKTAFAQLKIDEEAFAEKQKKDKLAFDEKQKADQKAVDDAQKLAKQTFDDAQKLKDEQDAIDKQLERNIFEEQLNLKKEDFDTKQNLKKETNETALNLKKEEFDTKQNLKKETFETIQNDKKKLLDDEQNLKKQKYEDDERVKKIAFDDAQNLKKIAFEDSERLKKQTFEDNLKTLEKQFKAEERAKDIATAQQVALIKGSANGEVVVASPRANGGRFDSGQQLLVGERGQELVTFGSGGYVSNATDTKQILQSNNSAPNSTSTAKMESLLSQLVGKLDRPNVSVQTSENPSDVLIKIQREAARSAAMSSGI